MSKSIKVSEQVYQGLLKRQLPRETFSQVISRLIELAELLVKVEPLIKGTHDFVEAQQRKREKEKATQ